MPKEKPDDFSSWSERLEKQEGIPELNMTDKEAAWEKLSGRLKRRERPSMLPKDSAFQDRPEPQKHAMSEKDPAFFKRITVRSRFWIAAAGLFIALISAGILLKGIVKNITEEYKTSGETVTRTDQKLPAVPVFPENPEFRENRVKPVKQTKPGVMVKNTDQVLSSKSSGTEPDKEIICGKVIPGVADFPEKDSAFLSSLLPVKSVDSGLRLAQQPIFPEKRKKELRVVHINEINDPAVTGPSLTGIPVERGFRINLGYRGMPNHPSVAANHPDPSVLKIKTSSQNQ